LTEFLEFVRVEVMLDEGQVSGADPSPLFAYLWDWFNDLSDWREMGSMAIGPLSHREIEAWSRLLCVNISPSEVDVLRQIDREYRSALYEKQNPKKAQFSGLHELAEINARRLEAKKAARREIKSDG
jgi:hypothetical protein